MFAQTCSRYIFSIIWTFVIASQGFCCKVNLCWLASIASTPVWKRKHSHMQASWTNWPILLSLFCGEWKIAFKNINASLNSRPGCSQALLSHLHNYLLCSGDSFWLQPNLFFTFVFFFPPFLWLFTAQMYVEVRSVRSESSHLSMSWSSSILLHFSKFLFILRWLIFPSAGILLGIKRVRLVVRAPSQNGEKRLPCLLNGTLFCHVLYLSILYLL